MSLLFPVFCEGDEDTPHSSLRFQNDDATIVFRSYLSPHGVWACGLCASFPWHGSRVMTTTHRKSRRIVSEDRILALSEGTRALQDVGALLVSAWERVARGTGE